MYIITLQDRSTFYMSIRVNINIYSKSFANTSARIWNAMQSEIEVNVSISKFKMSSKMYLQEHTLHSKYSK